MRFTIIVAVLIISVAAYLTKSKAEAPAIVDETPVVTVEPSNSAPKPRPVKKPAVRTVNNSGDEIGTGAMERAREMESGWQDRRSEFVRELNDDERNRLEGLRLRAIEWEDTLLQSQVPTPEAERYLSEQILGNRKQYLERVEAVLGAERFSHYNKIYRDYWRLDDDAATGPIVPFL